MLQINYKTGAERVDTDSQLEREGVGVKIEFQASSVLKGSPQKCFFIHLL